jgi:hypothetical protein
MNGLENTASERMLSSNFRPLFPAAETSAFDGPKLNPVPAPMTAQLPISVTWEFLRQPPPETPEGMHLHLWQMGEALADVNERLAQIEERNKCGEGLISRLRRLWR